MMAIRLIGWSAERLLTDALIELNVLNQSFQALVLALCTDIAEHDHSPVSYTHLTLPTKA